MKSLRRNSEMNINEEHINISYKTGSKVKMTKAATVSASGINTAQPTNTAANKD